MNNSPETNDKAAFDIISTNDTPKKNTYTLIHAIFAIIAIVIGSLWYNWIFAPFSTVFRDYPALPTTLFALIFAVFAVAFFKLRGAVIGKDSLIMLIAMLVFSARFAIYPEDYLDSAVGSIAYLVIHVCALLFLRCIGSPNTLDSIVGSTASAVFADPFASFHTLFASFSVFFKRRKSGEESKERAKKLGTEIGLVFLGICIALPILAVVLSLLGSDGFFTEFIGSALEMLERFKLDIDIGDYINIIIILVSLYIYGALYSADKKRTAEPEPAKDYSFLPTTVTNTVCITLLAVYVIFVISQIDGFAHMFMGELPEGKTYANFARSGFFELCTVACINGAVLYYSEIFAYRRPDGKRSSVIQLFVIGFTFFLIFTAAAKMIMYISAYGFTPKRFYTLWFMLLLAILFVFAIIKFRCAEFKMSRYSVDVTLLWLAVLLLVDFEWLSETLNVSVFGILS